ncbi:SDR family NAD(P)-dependent oxidoreductase [Mycolicibacterium sp. HK-90]|uniref:SDR family NAD(P)-dependent oxidoreductase n=1 Tax=Mycolicibacterium sp. HK-90 TaxID=3056937 RepID=UPI00265830B1|nr:SDR family NAD(P)-dependent oxidoreductase [Mycolicibacterium sp. HK-90]WKG06835.1 SDR family NAD(P)-dependent oxidoreductase [Mycolicibacterium sp. HK-90]
MQRWTSRHLPDQTGRVAVITGANTGIGLETAAALAGKGARVVLAVRDCDKGAAAAARIRERTSRADIDILPLDLTSMRSVHSAASELKAAYLKIDLLINNAGIMLTPKGVTEDGFELQFGTNHLGHFALTGLLLEQMLPVLDSRVVTVSSLGHRVKSDIDFDDLNSDRSYDPMVAYGRSKLANLLFTYELERRLAACATASTIAVAAHPGSARTDLFRHSPRWIKFAAKIAEYVVFQPASMGALPTLRAACDAGVTGGEYFGPRGLGQQRGYPTLVESSATSRDAALASRLWEVSEKLTGVTFPC